MRLSCSLPFSS